MQLTDTFILCIKLSEWSVGSQLLGGVISKGATNVYHWLPHKANQQSNFFFS